MHDRAILEPRQCCGVRRHVYGVMVPRHYRERTQGFRRRNGAAVTERPRGLPNELRGVLTGVIRARRNKSADAARDEETFAQPGEVAVVLNVHRDLNHAARGCIPHASQSGGGLNL